MNVETQCYCDTIYQTVEVHGKTVARGDLIMEGCCLCARPTVNVTDQGRLLGKIYVASEGCCSPAVLNV